MRSAIWPPLYKTDAIRTPHRMGTQGGTAYKKAVGTKPTASQFDGRVDWIRTSDPRVPNAVLYQTEPQPVSSTIVTKFFAVC